MISNVHYIELYINGDLVELESQDSLNLRINSVLFNPTKTTTTQAEYSYSFSIPSTPKNDRILNYANVLSKTNKFQTRYSAQVYGDGNLIFDGSLTIQKYNAKEKEYTCNLVNIKIDTLDEIFGDMVFTDLHWDVDFEGASTINSVNADTSTKYFFPLVSYGVFQKQYVSKDEVGATYTPKHDLDKYNKWWIESFYPSLNVIETMKRAFESKGYSVGGNALFDPNINGIYASCNLASEQSPIYNVGNPKFGQLSINTKWNNYKSHGESSRSFVREDNVFTNTTGGIPQSLKFPYERVNAAPNSLGGGEQTEYNFDTVLVWNLMDSTNNTAVTVTMNQDSYMYDPTEQLIVIPADGWYKIYLSCNVTLSGQGTTFDAEQWTTTYVEGDEFTRRTVRGLKRNFKDRTPFEVQLIRNYDDNVELIKGKTNVEYATGDPNQETYTYISGSYTGSTRPNRSLWRTECPHQDNYGAKSPTKTDELVSQALASRNGLLIKYGSGAEIAENKVQTNEYGNFGGTASWEGGTKYNTLGFMHKDGFIMPYDQVVSTAFICGMSTMSNGTLAVMRDEYSWSKLSTVQNKVFADVAGLDLINKTSDGTNTITTNYCKNTYKNGGYDLNVTNNTMQGYITCCVWLNKNDVLELVGVQRDYDGQAYSVSADCDVIITAMNDKSQDVLKADNGWNYFTGTEFPNKLNLFNFTNKETKVSDWISNITKAFNLKLVMEGNHVDINTNQGINKKIDYAVSIDDRVSSDEVESEYISYPREMSVQYKINTDEWGFELTVPPEHINDEDWEKWGDSGYTIIKLNTDTYATDTQNTSTQFSYTYYDHFNWKAVFIDGTESEDVSVIEIPVIEKAEYMAEGYGYDEAMKHDGYSMTQRFWYRQPMSQTPQYVWLSSMMANGKERIYLTYPTNTYERFNLSYKYTEKSIATEYFNIHPMLSSNFVNAEVFLNPIEYIQIKGGALIEFDDDLYYTSEIQAFDPSGNNPAKLKLIKKV